MSETTSLSAAEFDKGAQAARALLALAGAPTRSPGVAAAAIGAESGPIARVSLASASRDASDEYERGAMEARRLLGRTSAAGGSSALASLPRSTANAVDGDREKGAAEARRLLGIAGA